VLTQAVLKKVLGVDAVRSCPYLVAKPSKWVLMHIGYPALNVIPPPVDVNHMH
jgi:hypothetical protein